MADKYTLVASESSIQVFSPTVVQDAVVATIQTTPSKVIASLWIAQDTWDAGEAQGTLTSLADGIESVMASPKVVGATSGQTLDTNGLLQSDITFVVGYKPVGSMFPPATVDVTVPATEVLFTRMQGGVSSLQPVYDKIDAAYAQLVAAAGDALEATGTTVPPPEPPVT